MPAVPQPRVVVFLCVVILWPRPASRCALTMPIQCDCRAAGSKVAADQRVLLLSAMLKLSQGCTLAVLCGSEHIPSSNDDVAKILAKRSGVQWTPSALPEFT